jgi:hypothetical protein
MSNLDRTTNSDVWHVQLASGDVLIMSLDELDDAFNGGLIHEDTYVLQHGSKEWERLGKVAGLDAPEPAPAPKAAPRAQAAAVPTFVLPPTPMSSMRPVVSEISDLDLDEAPFRRRSKKKGLTVAFVGLLVIGGAAFAAVRLGVLRIPANPYFGPQAQAAAAAPALESNIAAAVVPPAQAAPKPSYDLSGLNATPPKLNDEQRRALLEADKVREAKHKTTRTSTPKRSSGPRHHEPTPFHKGGDPHDPLNSAL